MSDGAVYAYDADHYPLTAALNVIGGHWGDTHLEAIKRRQP